MTYSRTIIIPREVSTHRVSISRIYRARARVRATNFVSLRLAQIAGAAEARFQDERANA